MTETDSLRAQLDDIRGAHRIAADAADRFRDLIEEVLEMDTNPGDDELVSRLRAIHGKSGPERHRWRDFMVGAEAMRDQINAGHTSIHIPTDRSQ